MVFSSAWVAAAARVPAELCQRPGPGQSRRRLRADEVLRALFAPTAHELERLADCLFVFFCLPLPEPDQYYHLPVSARGGWAAPRGGMLYSFRRSLSVASSSSSSSWTDSSEEEEGLYYSDG
uniref:Uncharacterized protein n=1 Tax=Avena sativa TaxID=4498 RepID=A0ACD5V2C8_AVESA